LIILVNFLLMIEEITNYTKKDIDKGKTPPEIYVLCNCIRETFCISYSIRKNNNLYFYFHKENVLIKFIGNELRFLGSDERSQALLLNKALNKNDTQNSEYDTWIKSTPGIYFKKYSEDSSILGYLESIIKAKFIFLISDDVINNDLFPEAKNFNTLENITEYFYIIPTYSISKSNTNLIQLIKGLKNIQFIELLKIKAIHDKILHINYQIDKIHDL